MKRLAFTLSEILITLTIVGVVAVLTVPNVTQNVYTKSNIATLQTTMKTLNDAVKTMMVNEHTGVFADTSLAAAEYDKFYGKYLKYTKMSAGDLADCFGDNASSLTTAGLQGDCVVLPSGAGVLYVSGDELSSHNLTGAGAFVVDVNGKDAPSALGKDLFTFTISEDGQVGVNDVEADADVENCTGKKDLGYSCVKVLQNNGWKAEIITKNYSL